MDYRILIAGFGGQGILFAGKYLVYSGMLDGREVTWLPSYGPEMRGGTANCSVILSDAPIGSPIVSDPNILIAMNLPSLDRYEPAAVPSASVFVDSALIERRVARTDLNVFYIPATRLALENGLLGLANMVMIGNVLKKTGLSDLSHVAATMAKVVPEGKKAMFDKNITAVELGYNYQN